MARVSFSVFNSRFLCNCFLVNKCFRHRIITNAIVGIIVCVGLVLTFLHANSVLRQQVVLCIIFKVAICKIRQTNLLQGCKTSETQPGSSPGHLCQHGGSPLKLNFHKFEAFTNPRSPVVRSFTTFFLTISWSSGIKCGIEGLSLILLFSVPSSFLPHQWQHSMISSGLSG